MLDEVARANDIVAVIQGYFPLKRAGKDFKALCPFHPEKTPSFTVSPAKQIFKCFGCGRGGSVFNFIMLKENVTFPEAVRVLAERAGIELKDDPEARQRASARQQLRKALDWAVRYFEANLRHPETGKPGREYLAGRGISPEMIQSFRVGFAPEGWDNLLVAAEKAGAPAALLDAAGLVVRRDDGSGYYDRFRNRVIFPILDTLSRPVGFGGRTLADDPAKYLNSPETALFRKAENLYGLPQARAAIEQAHRAVVVEGYTDVIMPHQVGATNVVATLGTALTVEHVRILKRYADEVVLVFDSDLAGRRAADRGMELFMAEDVRVTVAALPEGKDPFDVCREEGLEAFRGYLAAAKDALEYTWDLVRKEFKAAESPAAQRRALQAMLERLAQTPILLSREPSVRRDLLVGRIGTALGVSEEALRRELARLRRQPGRSAGGLEVGANLPDTATRGRRWAAERDLLTALLHRPSKAAETALKLAPETLQTDVFRRLYEAIHATASHKDGDIESIVRPLDDPDLSAAAIELYERGEAIEACRDEADTGPGPLARLLEEAVEAIARLEDEEASAAHGRAARQVEGDDGRALGAFAEARKKRQGFLPPSAKRRTAPGT